MDIVFEKMSAADAQTLLDIQIRAFHQDTIDYGVEEGGPPDYDSLEHMLKDIEKYYSYKILADGKIVGGIVVWNYGEGHYHLDKIYIDPAYHNQGIGTKAMNFLEASYPATKWTLDTPAYALRNQHFYEKFGYLKVGEHEEADGFILFAYEKKG
jgi:ribosomal protein S18 acetylase RimI-like enzyme